MARANREVVAAFREKLGGVTRQAVEQRRDRIRRVVDMPPEIAMYIAAQREGVPTSKWLDADTLRTVAEFDAQVRAREGSRPPPAERANRGATKKATPVGKTVKIGEVTIPPGALNPQHVDEAIRMAEAYPLLYVFENSVREFLDGHLRAAYGDDWHLDTKIVNTDMRRRVERNKSAENAHRYHSRRNERFIYYTDLADLGVIAGSENGWKILKKGKILPSAAWLSSSIEKIEPSRNVVAHMNPIKARDTRRSRTSFKIGWIR